MIINKIQAIYRNSFLTLIDNIQNEGADYGYHPLSGRNNIGSDVETIYEADGVRRNCQGWTQSE